MTVNQTIAGPLTEDCRKLSLPGNKRHNSFVYVETVILFFLGVCDLTMKKDADTEAQACGPQGVNIVRTAVWRLHTSGFAKATAKHPRVCASC